eukprot:2262699-Pleurochrysis_carterae.AAC.2
MSACSTSTICFRRSHIVWRCLPAHGGTALQCCRHAKQGRRYLAHFVAADGHLYTAFTDGHVLDDATGETSSSSSVSRGADSPSTAGHARIHRTRSILFCGSKKSALIPRRRCRNRAATRAVRSSSMELFLRHKCAVLFTHGRDARARAASTHRRMLNFAERSVARSLAGALPTQSRRIRWLPDLNFFVAC